MKLTTWERLISECMVVYGETFRDVVASTMTHAEMQKEFDDGYGSSEGRPFTLWTKNRVYFPAIYNALEWVASAPRNPCDEKTSHIGGRTDINDHPPALPRMRHPGV